jgi:DNA-binding transcriptional ArsR family regulator
VTKREPRTITDSAVLAAMAHPLRRRIMDVLRVHGPSTASTIAERTGQAVGNVSHHLKVLASGDLIEQVPELAKDRRERWWRLVHASLRWDTGDFASDPATHAISDAVQSLNLEHHFQMVRTWYADPDDERQGKWSNGSFSADKWLSMTPDELYDLSQEIGALFARWANRPIPDDGQERETVFVFAHGVPGRP